MRFGLRAAALAFWVVAAVPADAQDAPGLAPSVPWTLDYDADSCALRRMFGTGEDQVYLEIRRFGPTEGLQAIIGTGGMKARRTGAFRYRFDSDTEWREVKGANTLELANGFSGVLFFPTFVDLPELEEVEDLHQRAAYLESIDFPALEREAAARITRLTLRGAFRRELTLELQRFDTPMAALNDCVDELMTHWNIDVEAHKTLTRPALPVNLPEVGSMIDYPPMMIRQNLQGVVNIRLAIDEAGRITGCHIQMPLSDPAFEETSCIDIQHALDFDPAIDKDGQPIASYWITRVHFNLK